MNREERITQLVLHMFTHQMAERIVDLEDEVKHLKENNKVLSRAFIRMKLDPSRLESALRMYVSELDYDIHKSIQAPEDGRPDQYPDEVSFFLRCWDAAGEG